MPNKDWYWDQFSVDVKQGELDLSDAQTSALAETGVEGRADYIDADRVNYETRFIDELYGTDERAWEGEAAPKDDGTWRRKYDAAIRTMGSGRSGKGGNYESAAQVTWGLDLVRDWTGKEDLKVGSNEHYQWQTRGKVDWAHYYNDNAYQKAFKEFRNEKDSGVADNYSTLKDFLTDIGNDAASTQSRVDFIREYEGHSTVDEESGLPDDWDNKYEDSFDPETAEPWKESYLDVPDLWGSTTFEEVETPIKVTKPANLPNLSDIKRTQVSVPDSIKSWGEAKSAPTGKYQAGGAGGE